MHVVEISQARDYGKCDLAQHIFRYRADRLVHVVERATGKLSASAKLVRLEKYPPFVRKLHAHADMRILQIGAIEGDDVGRILPMYINI